MVGQQILAITRQSSLHLSGCVVPQLISSRAAGKRGILRAGLLAPLPQRRLPRSLPSREAILQLPGLSGEHAEAA